jgi:hypothetical protein
MINLADKTTTFIQSVLHRTNKNKDYIISPSGGVSGIEIRMLPPLIKDNRTIRFWPFPGYAKLYCLTIVLSDISNQLSGDMDLNAFHGIGDNEYLPINKTIYYWEPAIGAKAPGQVHIMTAILKSKEALRDVSEILSTVKGEQEYESIAEELASALSLESSYQFFTEMSLKLAGVVAKHLGKIHDKPIGTVVNSFTRLHGDWDNAGIIPVKIITRNVDFNYELIVRDSGRD